MKGERKETKERKTLEVRVISQNCLTTKYETNPNYNNHNF